LRQAGKAKIVSPNAPKHNRETKYGFCSTSSHPKPTIDLIALARPSEMYLNFFKSNSVQASDDFNIRTIHGQIAKKMMASTRGITSVIFAWNARRSLLSHAAK
jgi:hypothetical protein